MSLAQILSACFSTAVRDRGVRYFTEGQVKIRDAQDGLVLARVQGARSYAVGLAREEDTLFGFCDCAYFEGNHLLCKHLWALLLAVDQRGRPDWAAQGVSNIVPDEDDGEEEDEAAEADAPVTVRTRRAPRTPVSRSPAWKLELSRIKARLGAPEPAGRTDWPAGRRAYYLLDFKEEEDWPDEAVGLELQLAFSDPIAKGGWSRPRFRRVDLGDLDGLPPGGDREILALLCGMSPPSPGLHPGAGQTLASRFRLRGAQLDSLLPLVCATGRCLLADPERESVDNAPGLAWDRDGAWSLHLEMKGPDKAGAYTVGAQLRRAGEQLELPCPGLRLAAGLALKDGRIARLDEPRAGAWAKLLQDKGSLELGPGQPGEFLAHFFDLDWIPPITLPKELGLSVEQPVPKPGLSIQGPRQERLPAPATLVGEISFLYGARKVQLGAPRQYLYVPEKKLLLRRDTQRELDAQSRLAGLGFSPLQSFQKQGGELMQIASKDLPAAVRELVAEGWMVSAQGRAFRQATRVRAEVGSGLDWFDLSLDADFEGQKPGLPELLAALKSRDGMVQLSDGSRGLLPLDWQRRFGLLAALGEQEGGKLRFKRSQAGLLDLLLAERDNGITVLDAPFKRTLRELLRADGLEPVQEPDSFVGALRPYQREGLAWMNFLQRTGFGGCLADDMGLGKTVQVLALLESRRVQKGRANRPPSLLVVPKSLVFNWQEEARRFTPGLKLLAHVGNGRAKVSAGFGKGFDAVLTTYGTLRQDILFLKDRDFDYLILDESQAAKNSASDTAKAVRLLKGAHRLALSGTPVENHLGELWNLLDFLNPGLLGASSTFKAAVEAGADPESGTLPALSAALRPFILRRTKDKVAKELPPKVEKTLFCELEPEQRRLYLELRDHYRVSLLDRVQRDGLAKSKMWVLEALLRLRQAACHPGLVDKSKLSSPCAKLEALLPRLREVVEEGHKALVFSQFTSFLAIARGMLEKQGIAYEYLDGKTQDRKERVERFQNGTDSKVFLISLKAGGVGLNLTAAEYVFLLDPWWNPAVEAQALDRAHRIGQTRQVFAYRLIAKDTVEEKVLQLQETKRRLADGILNADENVLRRLSREDLEALFS